MNESLDLLIRIQEIEIKMRILKELLVKGPQRLENLDAQLDDEKQLLDDKTRLVGEFQKKYRTLENNTQQIASGMAKSEEKLRLVKTNKEYQATLKEIDELKTISSKIEDEMIESLEELDAIERGIKQKKEDFKRFSVKISQEKDVVKQENTHAEKTWATLKSTYQKISDQIEDELLKQFHYVKRLQANKIAIVSVGDAVCRGCNLNIPPQMYNELQRGDKIMICPNCQRMIYWKKT